MNNLFWNKKRALLSGVLAIMLLAMAGVTIALLIDKTGDVNNAFTPSEVTCEVTEKFENNMKSEVCVKNTGDIAAFTRAAIVVTWQDGQGNIAATVPVEGKDYEMSLNFLTDEEELGWFEKDGYYYYTGRVEPDGTTKELINMCSVLNTAIIPDGYTLSVEIIADAIQADGVNADGVPAVVDAWGVTYNEETKTISK